MGSANTKQTVTLSDNSINSEGSDKRDDDAPSHPVIPEQYHYFTDMKEGNLYSFEKYSQKFERINTNTNFYGILTI